MIFEQNEILRARDELLRSCLEGFKYEISGVEFPKAHSWIIGNGIIGRLYITHLVKIMFNIQRLPFWEEKYSQNCSFDSSRKFFKNINNQMYNDSLKELRRLYAHTQSALNSNKFDDYFRGKKSSGYIKLKRGVGLNYAYSIIALAEDAKEKGLAKIEIPTYVLSSFAFKQAYSRDVEFSVDVPIEDILICSKTVAFSGDERDLRMPYDEEYVVINRDEHGLMGVNICDITYPSCVAKQILEKHTSFQKAYEHYGDCGMVFKPNMLYNLSPSQIAEPLIVRLAKALSEFWCRINN